jgi:hypothetical protein
LIPVFAIEFLGIGCRIAFNILCTTEFKRRPIPGGVFIWGKAGVTARLRYKCPERRAKSGASVAIDSTVAVVDPEEGHSTRAARISVRI